MHGDHAAVPGAGPAAGRLEEDVTRGQRTLEPRLEDGDVGVDGPADQRSSQLQGVLARRVRPGRVDRPEVNDQHRLGRGRT